MCRRAADDAGFSLVEVCITLVIMGTALSTLIYSVSAATTTSKLTEERSQTEESARQVAELVRASSTPFICDSYDLTQYVIPKVTVASGYTLTISNTKVSDGDPTVWRTEVPCSSGCSTCALLQTTITATGSGAQAGTSTVTVLKRDLTSG